MRLVHKFVVMPLILLMIGNGSAFADLQHVVSPSEIAASLAQHLAAQDADRVAVREALARQEVRKIANALGASPESLAAAVETLAGSDLEDAAATARQINQQLVGGATTVVISTTAIILVLLVIILLIVALK